MAYVARNHTLRDKWKSFGAALVLAATVWSCEKLMLAKKENKVDVTKQSPALIKIKASAQNSMNFTRN
jgi:hypothetical protein